MRIKIYQINLERDKEKVAFERLNVMRELTGQDCDSALYDLVFDGSVDASSLEDVFRIFNIEKPDGYIGRSLSVSDVVETFEGFYYCDAIGFKEIEFDSDKTENAIAKAKKIKVVVCEPNQYARIEEIESDLSCFQKIVGGYIETAYPFDEEVCIVCNEEGKINGSLPCRAIKDGNKVKDIIFGTFVICDCSGEDFDSLSEEQLENYERMFEFPEMYFRVNGGIIAIPTAPFSEAE